MQWRASEWTKDAGLASILPTPHRAIFERGKCDPHTEGWLLVGPDSYEGYEFRCKTIRRSHKREVYAKADGIDVYTSRFRCEGGDEVGGNAIETYRMWIHFNGELIVEWKK